MEKKKGLFYLKLHTYFSSAPNFKESDLQFEQNQKMEYLDLSECTIYPTALECLQGFKCAKYVNLSCVQINEENILKFCQMFKDLDYINMYYIPPQVSYHLKKELKTATIVDTPDPIFSIEPYILKKIGM